MLKMKALPFSETSVTIYHSAGHNISGGLNTCCVSEADYPHNYKRLNIVNTTNLRC